MKNLWQYQMDVFILQVRRVIKSVIPTFLLQEYLRSKTKKEKSQAFEQILYGDVFPWTSPNIWTEITDFYKGLMNPTIFEFGTGASTLSHLTELSCMERGTYIGIENDPTWFWLVTAAVIERVRNSDSVFGVNVSSPSDDLQEAVDVEILDANIRVLLRLRTSQGGYVDALDTACDVIIIDGIIRKKCVDKIIKSNFLKSGGLMMLMEAGRGSKNWWEGQLEGDADYSDEVEKLISLGGKLLDGTGLDSWPGCAQRSPRPVSYFYPMEACKLIAK